MENNCFCEALKIFLSERHPTFSILESNSCCVQNQPEMPLMLSYLSCVRNRVTREVVK